MPNFLENGWVVVVRTNGQPRSPDLTPCDFFLCSWLKEQVYSTKPRNLKKFEGRIREVITFIPQKFLVKSVDAVHGRLKEAGGK